jgi:hypothetical protein
MKLIFLYKYFNGEIMRVGIIILSIAVIISCNDNGSNPQNNDYNKIIKLFSSNYCCDHWEKGYLEKQFYYKDSLLTKVEYFSCGNNLIQTDSYEYDSLGKLLKIKVNSGSEYLYYYNNYNSFLNRINEYNDLTLYMKYYYEYNDLGKIKSKKDYYCWGMIDDSILNESDFYLYDYSGNLFKIVHIDFNNDTNQIEEFIYDSLFRLSEYRNQRMVANNHENYKDIYSYNDKNQVSQYIRYEKIFTKKYYYVY